MAATRGRAIPAFRRQFRRLRAARSAGLLAPVPHRAARARRRTDLDWADRPQRARLEPADPRSGQPAAGPRRVALRGHRRDRPLVRPALHQSAAHPTHNPIALGTEVPLAQIQPLPRAAYAEQTLDATTLLDTLAPEDWADYVDTIVRPNDDPDRKQGRYAVAARKRRRGECPFSRRRGASGWRLRWPRDSGGGLIGRTRRAAAAGCRRGGRCGTRNPPHPRARGHRAVSARSTGPRFPPRRRRRRSASGRCPSPA